METEDEDGTYTKRDIQPGISGAGGAAIRDRQLTLPEVARRLCLPQRTLKSWVYASRRGKLGEVGRNLTPLPDLEMELARVKRELVEVKMERDLLKKAAAYFAKESR